MAAKYSFQNFEKEKMARAIGHFPISTKQSIEICSFLRKKPLQKAKQILEEVMEKKQPVPFKRFNSDIGHKKGKIGPGRYPIKASKFFLKLLKSCEKNAEFKSLNTESLAILHISAYAGERSMHYGRKTRRKTKNTTIEIVVAETSQPEGKKAIKKTGQEKPKDVKKEQMQKPEKKPGVKPDTEEKEDKKEKQDKTDSKAEAKAKTEKKQSQQQEEDKGTENKENKDNKKQDNIGSVQKESQQEPKQETKSDYAEDSKKDDEKDNKDNNNKNPEDLSKENKEEQKGQDKQENKEDKEDPKKQV